MRHIAEYGFFFLLATALPSAAAAADAIIDPRAHFESLSADSRRGRIVATIAGRASVIDGRTLWFPQQRQLVRLAGIDACELPQWSYDPQLHGRNAIPKPAPCGPLAKAWLKRSLRNADVTCSISSHAEDGELAGTCLAQGRDLAIEMLRAGWARATGLTPAPPSYLAWQDHAMSGRYGMWATYVLDMNEWRRKAIDETLSRKPIADFNLLIERESEISPPFADARRRPQRIDR